LAKICKDGGEIVTETATDWPVFRAAASTSFGVASAPVPAISLALSEVMEPTRLRAACARLLEAIINSILIPRFSASERTETAT